MELKKELILMAKRAQEASRVLAGLPAKTKNKILQEMAAALRKKKNFILNENKKDVLSANAKGLSLSFINRLTLNENRFEDMCASLNELVKLPDPVGVVLKSWGRPNGLKIKKVRVPIGVIAIIYESRPNVTADCAGLCFKSGNSVILRGGSEAIHSNTAIYSALAGVLKKYAFLQGAINLVTSPDRKAVDTLLKLNEYIDLVMPRGGEGLIEKVISSSRIPVIKHYKGICHVYVDKYADLKMARKICFNAKVQRPGVCNAMESMLVHSSVAADFLPQMLKEFDAVSVEIRADKRTAKFAPTGMKIKRATEKDYKSEYLNLTLSVKVVDSPDEAIKHINYYGSHHSDTIVTANQRNSEEFLKRVDSACVYVNASTRFTDGYQFGFGAEIGISTDKLHARGPMGLEELTTYKYEINGSGQVRQ